MEISNALDIAIIGMAGRFPGAADIDSFWSNICKGIESIRSFSEAELLARGVKLDVIRDPRFIPAGAVLDATEYFDADFFGYAPRQASLLDPQHRLFMECAWQGLEDAGCCPETFPGSIGVFAGTSLSGYLLFHLLKSPQFDELDDSFELMLANDKDFLSTRVSYALNLTGPSVTVQTGCSTSLVATHLACQALLAYQCDLALAGGVSIHIPQRTGYFHVPGGISSPDGHCRAFAADSAGTVFGSGLGVVVLCRLEEALRRRHHVYAVIRGSAVSNDGSAKIGYTAPSLEGQTNVIAAAQAVAGAEPDTIAYLEAHGTGTSLGDSIEVAALTKAFRLRTTASQYCALGTVKSAVGHLDAAAGIAGLIKTALALAHRIIPPTMHHTAPDTKLKLESSPFYLNSTATDWKSAAWPRRAGVSSFGIGGTNAHVVLEEAANPEPGVAARHHQLLILSARDEKALDQVTADLAQFLERPDTSLVDVSFTLQTGRRAFPLRRTLVCREPAEAVQILTSADRELMPTSRCELPNRPIAFLFPGGGTQHVGMGRDLYREEPVFRENIDRCASVCESKLSWNLLELLYPLESREEAAAVRMRRSRFALPALFAVEHALARLWMSWGLRPTAMIGHSLGEYSAACIAGVLSLEDALEVVAVRGELFERLPSGGMLTAAMAEMPLRELIGSSISIAAVNGPEQSVLSGSIGALDAAATLLSDRGIETQRIHIDVAAHSAMTESILSDFERFIRGLHLAAPSIPFISNVTGRWISPREATDPSYWAQHLRQTVLFSKGIRTLLTVENCILLEVGPGRALISLARLHGESHGHPTVQSLRHPNEPVADQPFLLQAIGKLWTVGCPIDWEAFHSGGSPRRVRLPTYPYQRQRCWIVPPDARVVRGSSRLGKITDPREWTYLPSWRSSPIPTIETNSTAREWIIVGDGQGIGESLVQRLRAAGEHALEVRHGVPGRRLSDGTYVADPQSPSGYRQLLEQGIRVDSAPIIVYLAPLGGEAYETARFRDIYCLLRLAHTVCSGVKQAKLCVVTNNGQRVESADIVDPFKSMLVGPCFVLQQEYEGLSTQFIDVTGRTDHAAELLLCELRSNSQDKVVSWRRRQRWVRSFAPHPLPNASAGQFLRSHGVYLITGGLGNVGRLIARYLTEKFQARLVLTTRDNSGARRAERLRQMQLSGGETSVVEADAADDSAMHKLVESMRSRYGRIDGVIHLAGVTGEAAFQLSSELSLEDIDRQCRAKVEGARNLSRILVDDPPGFVLLFSSNASVLGGVGLSAYAAANCYVDALAIEQCDKGQRWISAGWDGWPTTADRSVRCSIDRFTMTAIEALDVFCGLIQTAPAGHIIVSTGDLEQRVSTWITKNGNERETATGVARSSSTPYERPQGATEQTIARIWQELLGVDRVGLHDNFFELGGNSLIGLKVIAQLRAKLQLDLRVVALFEGPTVKSLAAIIDRQDSNTFNVSESRGQGRRERLFRPKSHA